jgi:soluble lytic murein transglycosylase
VTRSGIRRRLAGISVVGALVLTEPSAPRAQTPVARSYVLEPTAHPPVARDAAQLWLVPSDADRVAALSNPALAHFQAAQRYYSQKQFDQALARFTAAASTRSPVRPHAEYYAGVAELRLERFQTARERFSRLKDIEGFIGEAAALGEAEATQELRRHGDAVKIYERLVEKQAVDKPAIWLSLANAALADGDHRRAGEAFLRVYYEFPLSGHAADAERGMRSLSEVQPIAPGNLRYRLELGRGERLFGSRRYSDARTSFLRLKPHAKDDEADLTALRLAEIEYFLGDYRDARDNLRPFLSRGPRQAEARFFYAMAHRGLKSNESFESMARALAADFPETTWAEDSLNALGTYYLQQDLDDDADVVFRELYSRFPKSRHAERAAWKAGWRAYRKGRMADAVHFFESASAGFPRSDYRPAWLYWSGRAREAMGDKPGGIERLRLTVADYENTYYGRLATAALKRLGSAPAQPNLVFVRGVTELSGEDDRFPPNADTVRTLLALGLYQPAVEELEFAKEKWGESPAILATLAWTNKQMAASETGSRQFALARGSINTMKRAYPQFMASGGEELPREIQTTIFPLSYWDLIRKYSARHDLDPYLVAALMAQESTFVRDIRSHANAYGLMQLLPSTARQYARKFKIRYSSALLTTPEPNIRIGTAYLADKIAEFGAVHLALASYNAGETPVRRWMRERPGLPRDEFIDDIPYPETQQYVKRLLGTAEDYRRLYASK